MATESSEMPEMEVSAEVLATNGAAADLVAVETVMTEVGVEAVDAVSAAAPAAIETAMTETAMTEVGVEAIDAVSAVGAAAPAAVETEGAVPAVAGEVAASDLPPRPPPRPKPITWETERNDAVVALARVGASPREARVLASSAAKVATEMRAQSRQGKGDAATVDDRAARQVLAAHRANGVPSE